MDVWVEAMGNVERTRQCSKCVHFREGHDGFLPGSKAFTGRCTHPARQLPYDPQPWVRDRELACRLEWDRDLYEARDDGDDRVLDVRTIEPNDPRGDGKPRNVLQRLLILDDLIPSAAIRDERIGIAILPDRTSVPFDADELTIKLDTRLQVDSWLTEVDLLRHLWRRHR